MSYMKNNNNYCIKTLDYLFRRIGIKSNLKRMEKIYKKHWNCDSMIELLNQMKINYEISNEIKTLPCIYEDNDYSRVVLDLKDKQMKVWDPKYNRMKLIKEHDSLKYINITFLNDNQLHLLDYNFYLNNKYKFILNNIILLSTFIFLACLEGFLVDMIGFMIFMILDYYMFFVDFSGMFTNIAVCIVCIIGLIFLNYLSDKTEYKIVEKNDLQLVDKQRGYFQLLNCIISSFVILIFIGHFNTNISLLTILQILSTLLLNKYLLKIDQKFNFLCIRNINIFYLLMNLVMFVLEIICLLFNNDIGFSIISLFLVGYAYITLNNFRVQNFMKNIHEYNIKFNEVLYKSLIIDKTVDEKNIDYSKGILISGIYNFKIKANQSTLILGNDKVRKVLLSKIFESENNNVSNLIIKIGDIELDSYSKNDISKKIIILNNNLYGNKDINIGRLLNDRTYYEDLKELMFFLGYEKLILNKEMNISQLYIDDTEQLIIEVVNSILTNPYYIIFDNVLSRFNNYMVERIIKVCRQFNITVILLEQRNIMNKEIDCIIDLDIMTNNTFLEGVNHETIF